MHRQDTVEEQTEDDHTARGRLPCHALGHCEGLALIDADTLEKEIPKREDIEARLHEPGLLPPWVAERGADTIIAGGMGQRTRTVRRRGMGVMLGVSAETAEKADANFPAGMCTQGGMVCDR